MQNLDFTQRSTNFDSWNSKLKEENFVCTFCNKTLVKTPEYTGSRVEEIEVLIKLNANVLHVCNSFTEKRVQET